MGIMTLGEITFDFDPDRNYDVVKPKKHSATELTYGGVAYFNWGADIVGQEIDLDWEYMSTEQYELLQTYYLSDEEIIFDQKDNIGTYNVKVTDLKGSYFLRIPDDSGNYRKNVSVKLLILSQNLI